MTKKRWCAAEQPAKKLNPHSIDSREVNVGACMQMVHQPLPISSQFYCELKRSHLGRPIDVVIVGAEKTFPRWLLALSAALRHDNSRHCSSGSNQPSCAAKLRVEHIRDTTNASAVARMLKQSKVALMVSEHKRNARICTKL
eukprot:SAG11_NODE_1216_length_5501_cov_2.800629_7_plen_142_part_00